MAATLRAVAAIDNLIMKRENDCCRLKAIRFAMKNGRFRTMVLVFCEDKPFFMRSWTVSLLFFLSFTQARAQREPDVIYMKNINAVKFHQFGNQLSFPIIQLNSDNKMELHFDDMEGGVKYYFYTLELRNADWTPAQMSYFDYVKGFTQQRINTYRVSSAMISRYTHYQVTLPDRNIMPTKSGNYVLKVFLNGDTSKLAFTRKLLVVDPRFGIAAQVQQPFAQQFFRTHHRLLVQVSTKGFETRYPQQQVKLFILQNYRWDNALKAIQPTFLKPDLLEFVNEQEMLFPAVREWRWANLRSFRLLGDRVSRQQNTDSSFTVFVQDEKPRVGSPYFYFNDMNGMYINETVEKINPLWEADFSTVHFTFVPPGGVPYRNRDLYLFGELTGYGRNQGAKLVFNETKRMYETDLVLKQGYYDYCYTLKDPRSEVFETDQTEGNAWETENSYTVLVYFRELGGRYDQLLGMNTINSQFARPQ
jgi:hypothetical protein